jgi:hypothetical protein
LTRGWPRQDKHGAAPAIRLKASSRDELELYKGFRNQIGIDVEITQIDTPIIADVFWNATRSDTDDQESVHILKIQLNRNKDRAGFARSPDAFKDVPGAGFELGPSDCKDGICRQKLIVYWDASLNNDVAVFSRHWLEIKLYSTDIESNVLEIPVKVSDAIPFTVSGTFCHYFAIKACIVLTTDQIPVKLVKPFNNSTSLFLKRIDTRLLAASSPAKIQLNFTDIFSFLGHGARKLEVDIRELRSSKVRKSDMYDAWGSVGTITDQPEFLSCGKLTLDTIQDSRKPQEWVAPLELPSKCNGYAPLQGRISIGGKTFVVRGFIDFKADR